MSLNVRLPAVLLLLVAACAHLQPTSVSVPSDRTTEAAPQSEMLRVHFTDVKQADAILIQLGNIDLLIDAGVQAGCANLRKTLEGVSGSIEVLFITHPHDDHYGCATDVLERHDVKRIITNGERRGPPRDDRNIVGWDKFVSAAQQKGLTLESLPVGTKLSPADGLALTVLATGSSEGGEFQDTNRGEDINNDSLVMRIDFAGRSVLLTGDIEGEAGAMLVKRYCADDGCPALKADVLKVPHHGSAKFDREFFERVHPTFAVVSADYRSAKHHLPRRQPLDVLRSLGAKIYSTSADGTENVLLEITKSGAMNWHAPSQPGFAWDGADGEGVSFAQ